MLLGVLRAGLIAAPLPMLWRRADMARALGRIGARALVVPHRVGAVDYGDVAVHVAAETFAIRFVFGFGDPLPDGVISLSDVFTAPAAAASLERGGDCTNDVAVVTFEVTSDGIIALARSNAQLAAAGAAVVSELGDAGADARIISGASITLLAGLACGAAPGRHGRAKSRGENRQRWAPRAREASSPDEFELSRDTSCRGPATWGNATACETRRAFRAGATSAWRQRGPKA